MVEVYFKSLFGKTVSLIYMKIFQRLKSRKIRLVYHILQSFYELKEARWLWNKKFIKFFLNLGFVITNGDLCIYTINKSWFIY